MPPQAADHRLGAHEAPPAVVSMFLGDELNDILEAIENDTAYDAKEAVQMKVGVHVLPQIPQGHNRQKQNFSICVYGQQI